MLLLVADGRLAAVAGCCGIQARAGQTPPLHLGSGSGERPGREPSVRCHASLVANRTGAQGILWPRASGALRRQPVVTEAGSKYYCGREHVERWCCDPLV